MHNPRSSAFGSKADELLNGMKGRLRAKSRLSSTYVTLVVGASRRTAATGVVHSTVSANAR
jgi:hypothetical protein